MRADLELARSSAERFRHEHVSGRLLDRLPLDVVYLADAILKLDLISFPSLENLIESSAYITPSLTEMYLDEALFASYESPRAPSWQKDRLRFSVAHELGHIAMHRNFVEKVRCRDLADFKTLLTNNDDVRYKVEKEANEFAGRLLVPLTLLESALKGFTAERREPRWRDSAELRERFCEATGPRFGVNKAVISVRLDREKGLWPNEWTYGG